MLLPHVTGALVRCGASRPYMGDVPTLELTKQLVADQNCFNVRDVSKLGLLVFGDTPITRIIKEDWVPLYTYVVTALESAVFNSVGNFTKSGGRNAVLSHPSRVLYYAGLRGIASSAHRRAGGAQRVRIHRPER